MYAFLLHLYPASFRNEYGGEMGAVFKRARRDADGPAAVCTLWAWTIAETLRNATLVHWDLLKQDLAYTARTLRRAPGFVFTAIAIVGLGIGATTAAFSVTDAVLLRPLPFPEGDRILKVWERRPGFARMELSPANYRDLKASVRSFEAWGAYRGLAVNFAASSEPRHLVGSAMTADVFRALGVHAALGRLPGADDDREESPRTVVLSDALWRAEFGGDPSIVGRTIRLDDHTYTVIGVMPAAFLFPTAGAQLWTPMRFAPADFEDRNDNFLQSVARLRNGVSADAARAELAVAATALKRQYPKENANTDVAVFALREVSQQSRLLLTALLAAAVCVLLIACANLAGLLLARGVARARELAVRTAMGAGRERLIRQLLTESLVLAVAGGGLGLALAAAGTPLLSQLVPTTLPIARVQGVDIRILLFAGGITLLTGLLFGVAPVLRIRRAGDVAALRDGVRAGGGSKERARSILVVAEIVASIVLLVSTGLLLQALLRVQAIDPGFKSENVLTLRTALPMPRYESEAAREAFISRVLEGVRALPGVASAAYTSFVPLGDVRGGIFPVGVGGVLADRRENHVAVVRFVTPGFFDTVGIPIRRGRDVGASDTRDRAPVALVSESFVRRYWPDQDPIGRRFRLGSGELEVVGVVGDIRVRGLERVSEPQVYPAYRQVADGAWVWYAPKDLVVRTTGAPGAMAPAIRAVIAQADPQQPVSNVRPLTELVARETASRMVLLRVLAAFALMAFVLAGVGIHGVLSFAVSQRSQEIGVRVALGARPRDILSMVLGRCVVLAVAGVIPGLALAYAAGRSMEALLAGVRPADTATMAAAVGLAVVMTVAGSVMPTIRALRVDPITAIRAE